MNKYEQRAQQQRRGPLGMSKMLWSAAAALVVVVLLIVGLSSSAPPQYYSRMAIGAAIVLLVMRQIARRTAHRRPRAAEPDPKSRLNLQ
ncbi:MAG: hypothetical protein ACJ746_05895 [Bryobacteraceae bacterium]